MVELAMSRRLVGHFWRAQRAIASVANTAWPSFAGDCAGDAKALCKDVNSGDGRLAACLTKKVRAQRQGNTVGASSQTMQLFPVSH